MSNDQPTKSAEVVHDLATALCNQFGIHTTLDNLRDVKDYLHKARLHGYTQGNEASQWLADQTADHAASQQTSIIRATVAAVLEAVRDNDPVLFQLDSMHVKMNLEAQRTIWDRVELTTERDASQENVTFTVHKK